MSWAIFQGRKLEQSQGSPRCRTSFKDYFLLMSHVHCLENYYYIYFRLFFWLFHVAGEIKSLLLQLVWKQKYHWRIIIFFFSNFVASSETIFPYLNVNLFITDLYPLLQECSFPKSFFSPPFEFSQIFQDGTNEIDLWSLTPASDLNKGDLVPKASWWILLCLILRLYGWWWLAWLWMVIDFYVV